MVALAACLLEFPVAYVPTFGPDGDSNAFLAGVPLDVYECILACSEDGSGGSCNDGHEHVMLKFSCPQTVGNDVWDLAPGVLVERLASRFTDRVRPTNSSCRVVVRHHVETLDRVAL
ncbi:hypothetical protein C8Q76DRAFT_477648 [Earliella scabrosa]|nr:hypothetical protein C8Q76DRAFT_477648 [Earliella scabrosa]